MTRRGAPQGAPRSPAATAKTAPDGTSDGDGEADESYWRQLLADVDRGELEEPT